MHCSDILSYNFGHNQYHNNAFLRWINFSLDFKIWLKISEWQTQTHRSIVISSIVYFSYRYNIRFFKKTIFHFNLKVCSAEKFSSIESSMVKLLTVFLICPLVWFGKVLHWIESYSRWQWSRCTHLFFLIQSNRSVKYFGQKAGWVRLKCL